MSQFHRTYLLAAGSAMVAGALLHIAIAFGGPSWYAFFGAPPGLVAMASTDSLRPLVSCVVIAAMLLACSAYAYSGAGIMRGLPGLRVALALIGAGLIVRGIAFVPIVALQPHLLSGLCGNCHEVNSFVLVTSTICLVVGLGYAVGAVRAHA